MHDDDFDCDDDVVRVDDADDDDANDDVKDILTVLRGKETKTGRGRPHSLQ